MYSDRDRHKRDVDERTKDKIEYKLLTICLVNNNPRYGINFNINYFTSKILAQHVWPTTYIISKSTLYTHTKKRKKKKEKVNKRVILKDSLQ